jgi:hypothetical protein
MAPKANISLPDGTKIELDGSLEELQALTEHLHSRSAAAPQPRPAAHVPPAAQRPADTAEGGDGDDEPDIARIVAIIRDCDEAETIEKKVLDKRDVMNRVLLCLWIVQKYVSQTMGLTSGDAEKITDQLGIKVHISHASTTLSDRAKAYVTGDSVRRKGGAVHYRLNRRGTQYFEGVLAD